MQEEESLAGVQIENDTDHEKIERSLIEGGRNESIAAGNRQGEQSEMQDTFSQQLDRLMKYTLTEFQERGRLRKLKIDEKMKEEANAILENHLKSVDSMGE